MKAEFSNSSVGVPGNVDGGVHVPGGRSLGDNAAEKGVPTLPDAMNNAGNGGAQRYTIVDADLSPQLVNTVTPVGEVQYWQANTEPHEDFDYLTGIPGSDSTDTGVYTVNRHVRTTLDPDVQAELEREVAEQHQKLPWRERVRERWESLLDRWDDWTRTEGFDGPKGFQFNTDFNPPRLDMKQVPSQSRDQVQQVVDRTDQLIATGNAVDCHLFGIQLGGGHVDAMSREKYDAHPLYIHEKGDEVGIADVDATILPDMQPLILIDGEGNGIHTIVRLPGSDERFISKLGHSDKIEITDLATIADKYGAVSIAHVRSASIKDNETGELLVNYKAPGIT